MKIKICVIKQESPACFEVYDYERQGRGESLGHAYTMNDAITLAHELGYVVAKDEE